MLRTVFIIMAAVCAAACSSGNPVERKGQTMTEKAFCSAERQMSGLLKTLDGSTGFPHSMRDGAVYCTQMTDWTEGFFPGCLWYLYGHTGGQKWKDAAAAWTWSLEPMKKFTGDHDIGFLIMSSFGNAYRQTGETEYANVLVEAANSLCERFDETAGCIKSWNYKKSWSEDEWFFPVVISNLANLELLYLAAKLTGNSGYAEIADRHAGKTMASHIREDGSCYEVVNFDKDSGAALSKGSYQGFSDDSAWARGQAWAIYGFTMAYRESGKKEFLEAAEKTASFWLCHRNLPDDGIPYWDFDAGSPGFSPDWNYDSLKYAVVPRDASAAAIAASAFLELSRYSSEPERYFKAGEHILKTLSSPEYLAEPGTNGGFILKHSVGSMPKYEDVDVPLVCTDYYYLEALTRYEELK